MRYDEKHDTRKPHTERKNVNIEQWLDKNEMKGYEFAKLCKVAPATIYRSIRREQQLSCKNCEKIESMTLGDVTREEAMWPDFNFDVRKRRED